MLEFEMPYEKGMLIDIDRILQNNEKQHSIVTGVKVTINLKDVQILPGDIFTHKRSGVDFSINPFEMKQVT